MHYILLAGALQKKIKVAVQVQKVPQKLLKLTCPTSPLKFSPLVAIEPRRRRFHHPVQVKMTRIYDNFDKNNIDVLGGASFIGRRQIQRHHSNPAFMLASCHFYSQSCVRGCHRYHSYHHFQRWLSCDFWPIFDQFWTNSGLFLTNLKPDHLETQFQYEFAPILYNFCIKFRLVLD